MLSLRAAVQQAIEKARTITLAASKRARRVRTSGEFDVASLIPTMRSPIVSNAAWSWDIPSILQARDDQMIGRFVSAVRLAESMRTDDALYSAYQNRIAPQRCLNVELQLGKGPKATTAFSEADALFGSQGVALHPDTMSDIEGCLAQHGVAIGVNAWTPRANGSRIDVEHKMWPLEFVWWNQAARCLMTRVDPFPGMDVSSFGTIGLPKDPYGSPPLAGSNLTPIIHGDGRWTIYQKHDFMPWRQDAALLPAALVWAAHAFGMRDWAKGSAAHGSSKIIGELPQGFDIGSLDNPTPDGKNFIALLAAIASDDTPFGIKPFGSKVEILANPGNMWQVFVELVNNREKAAHRIYTGTDAALGAQGGAPGVDIVSLFGVSQTIVQGDLEALERGLLTGVIQPWAAINHGDSMCAPTRRYVIPDGDANAIATQDGSKMTAYIAALNVLKTSGLLTQDTANWAADAFHVCPIVVPAALPPVAPSAPALSVVR